MQEYVWLSVLETINEFRNYGSADIEGISAKEGFAATINWQGDVVLPKYVPSAVRPADGKVRKFEELNLLRNGFLLVGPGVAAVLRQFDLGKGGLIGVDLLDTAGAVVSSGEYFFWNFGNKRTHFLPEKSIEVRKSNYGNEKPGEHIYSPPVIPKDDTLAFSRECLTGPDVWREKFLAKGTLLSDRLVSALRSARLDGMFELVRCRVL